MKILKNRIFLALICVLLSAVCVYSFLLANSSEDITIYKLKSDVSQGAVITADMIESVDVGSKGLDNVITDKTEILNKYATEDLLEGQFIFINSVSEKEEEQKVGLEKLDGEHFLYSISVKSLASSVSYNIQAGDIVSIYVIDDFGASYLDNALNYVEIYDVYSSSGTSISDNGDDAISTISFIVSKEQLEKIHEFEYTKQMHLALVYRGEDDTKTEYLAKQDELISEETPVVEISIDNIEQGESEWKK